VAGEAWSVEDLLARLLADEPFYRRSGGGVTLSGGEPTAFPEVAGKLAAELRAREIHVLLETCGHFAWQPFAAHLLPHLSAIYFDLKIADPDDHRRRCGVDNRRIHDNLKQLASVEGIELLPRIPLVPSITDGRDNLVALADLALEAGLERIALLPYNPLWVSKRRGLGLDLPYDCADWMSAEAVRAAEATVAARGIAVVARGSS
jgi:pyruvate formate lyase activating enzyme